MLNRRLLVGGGLTLAVAPSLITTANAQASKITVVFAGHEL
jgi:hypothetical protein